MSGGEPNGGRETAHGGEPAGGGETAHGGEPAGGRETAHGGEPAGGGETVRIPARERWNQRYAERGARSVPDEPVDWLAENFELVLTAPGRRALEIACGAGRNALYLAQLGFAVTAIDVSDVAIASLRAAALEHGLDVDARRVDLEVDPIPPGPYDLVVQTYYLQRDLFPVLERELAPGGVLVIETMTKAQADELGRAFDPTYLLDDGELLATFPELVVRRYREGPLDGSGRPRPIASLVAHRPLD